MDTSSMQNTRLFSGAAVPAIACAVYVAILGSTGCDSPSTAGRSGETGWETGPYYGGVQTEKSSYTTDISRYPDVGIINYKIDDNTRGMTGACDAVETALLRCRLDFQRAYDMKTITVPRGPLETIAPGSPRILPFHPKWIVVMFSYLEEKNEHQTQYLQRNSPLTDDIAFLVSAEELFSGSRVKTMVDTAFVSVPGYHFEPNGRGSDDTILDIVDQFKAAWVAMASEQ